MRDRDRERAAQVEHILTTMETVGMPAVGGAHGGDWASCAKVLRRALAEARAQAETDARPIVDAALALLAAEERVKAAERMAAYGDAMAHWRAVDRTFLAVVAEYRRQHPTTQGGSDA